MNGWAGARRIFRIGVFLTIGVSMVDVKTGGAESSIPARAEDVRPLGVGNAAPAPTLRDPNGNEVRLADVYAQGPTMLIFYRGGWCPFCNVHLGHVAEAEPKLRAMGVQVVALSPDKPEELRKSVADRKLDYRLLSDSDMACATAFGLAFRVDDATLERYRGFGVDLEAASGERHHLLPVPAVYLVDRGGTIRFAHWNPDYKTRLSATELIGAAKKITRE